MPAANSRPAWGADVPVSMPLPAAESVMVPMYGFGMTQYRLVHDLSQAEYEELSVPVYAPEAAPQATVAGDAGIESSGTFSG